jgi:hypothetical protein
VVDVLVYSFLRERYGLCLVAADAAEPPGNERHPFCEGDRWIEWHLLLQRKGRLPTGFCRLMVIFMCDRKEDGRMVYARRLTRK